MNQAFGNKLGCFFGGPKRGGGKCMNEIVLNLLD